jgi:hypothetical protein
MRHYLDNRLEQFFNGSSYLSDNKTNGYHAAKVPDWALRRWLVALEHDATPELLEALDYYADQLCEGWCEQSPDCAHFDDCGGCLARRTAWRARGQ